MPNSYEKPVVTPTPDSPIHKETVTHPAYGMIGASRIQGGKLILFGSDFIHDRSIAIRIHHSELNRDSTSEHHFATKQICEVYLSEAQWATFVSSLNVGDGVPCTITALGGKNVPMIPSVPDRAIQFTEAAKERLQKSMDALTEMSAKIDGMKISTKAKDELNSFINTAKMNIGSNLKYVATQFGEHIEDQVEKAKMEISAYVHSTVMRAGLESLGVPIQIATEMKALEE